ncbi:hypothetical protein CBER1_08536 [Cercospora berteroae]|uniref:Uncharacterized protein n=1 Tax=Cercospora berteroae TaxID=357750 RepID=A0A2S6BUL8_9PEZI|nr:hypothetical protein CBER1_08536 [Cercospora berteroae]
MKDSDILELYNDLHEQHSECGERCDLFSTTPAVKVTKRVRQCVTEAFFEEGDVEWRDEHDERIAAWHRRVGSPTATSRGRFDEFSNVLTKHFGLQAWVSHVQESRELGYLDESVAHTTKAYLRLPRAASVTHDFELHFIDSEWSPRRQPTEAGFASELSIPQPISTKETRRFTRALKVLELAGPAKPKGADSMQGNKSMPSGTESSDTKGAPVNAELKPTLTLLIRNDDDEEY